MKLFAKIFIVSSVLFFGGLASAQTAGTKAVSGALGTFASNTGTVSDSDHAFQQNLSGFFGLGGDFDYFLENDMSVGAIFRYYSAADTLAHVDYTDTLTTIGAVFRAYLLDTSHFSFVGTGGIGLADAKVTVSPPNASNSADSSMTFGLYMGWDVMYKLNSTTRIGVENMRILGLGRGRLNGWVLSDYMAKVTFFF
jgi:hypothetical protein